MNAKTVNLLVLMSANGIMNENIVFYNKFLFYINFLDFLFFMKLLFRSAESRTHFVKNLTVLMVIFIVFIESTNADVQFEPW